MFFKLWWRGTFRAQATSGLHLTRGGLWLQASLSLHKDSFSTDTWMTSLPPYQPVLKFRANWLLSAQKCLFSQPGSKSFEVEKDPILPKALLQSENSLVMKMPMTLLLGCPWNPVSMQPLSSPARDVCEEGRQSTHTYLEGSIWRLDTLTIIASVFQALPKVIPRKTRRKDHD